jgi:hypothetical protein
MHTRTAADLRSGVRQGSAGGIEIADSGCSTRDAPLPQVAGRSCEGALAERQGWVLSSGSRPGTNRERPRPSGDLGRAFVMMMGPSVQSGFKLLGASSRIGRLCSGRDELVA